MQSLRFLFTLLVCALVVGEPSLFASPKLPQAKIHNAGTAESAKARLKSVKNLKSFPKLCALLLAVGSLKAAKEIYDHEKLATERYSESPTLNHGFVDADAGILPHHFQLRLPSETNFNRDFPSEYWIEANGHNFGVLNIGVTSNGTRWFSYERERTAWPHPETGSWYNWETGFASLESARFESEKTLDKAQWPILDESQPGPNKKVLGKLKRVKEQGQFYYEIENSLGETVARSNGVDNPLGRIEFKDLATGKTLIKAKKFDGVFQEFRTGSSDLWSVTYTPQALASGEALDERVLVMSLFKAIVPPHLLY